MVVGVIAGALAALGSFAQFIWSAVTRGFEFLWETSNWIVSTFRYDNPLQLLFLSLVFMVTVFILLFALGGAGIAGADWNKASGKIEVGKAGALIAGSSFGSGACTPGVMRDLDCDGIPDEYDGDRDGDGIPNSDDQEPDNVNLAGGGTPTQPGTGPPTGAPSPPQDYNTNIGCPNSVCENVDTGTMVYQSRGAGDGVVYCGVPVKCLDQSRSGCGNLELGRDVLCQGLPASRTQVVGTSVLNSCLSQYCGVRVADHSERGQSELVINRSVWYVEDNTSCPADCRSSGNVGLCRNGIKDETEDGIDCGGACPNSCQCLTSGDCETQGLTAATCGLVNSSTRAVLGRVSFAYCCPLSNRCVNAVPVGNEWDGTGMCGGYCLRNAPSGPRDCDIPLGNRTWGEVYSSFGWVASAYYGMPAGEPNWQPGTNYTLSVIYPTGRALFSTACDNGAVYDSTLAAPQPLAPENLSLQSGSLRLDYLG
jgi:hypothetical protein